MEASIIIVNWNAKNFLKNCLNSLASALSGIEHEIIVIDNASADGSQEMLKSNFPNVKLICNQENLGFAKANNIGINICSGRVIFLINSDVVVFEDCFRKLILFLDANENVGLVGPKILDSNGLLQRSIMSFPTIWNNFTRALALDNLSYKLRMLRSYMTPLLIHEGTKKVDVVNGCFWMIRREALQKVGLLDERFFIYGEDIDLCKRFNDQGWKVMYFSSVSVIHFGGASSANAPIKFYIEMIKANYQFWIKHFKKAYSDIYLILVILHHLNRFIGNAIQILSKTSTRPEINYYKTRKNALVVKWAVKELLKI